LGYIISNEQNEKGRLAQTPEKRQEIQGKDKSAGNSQEIAITTLVGTVISP
jgi:hypothetical protein